MSGDENKQSQTSLNTIHRLQGSLLSQSFTVEYEGKKIIVVPLDYASKSLTRAYSIGKQNHPGTEFNTDKKIDKALARLHRLLDKHDKL